MPDEGEGTVTILYSDKRDLYRIPAMDKPFWLSVATHSLPAPTDPSTNPYFMGAAPSPDGITWREAYSTLWLSVVPGNQVAIPASHPLAQDYAAYEV